MSVFKDFWNFIQGKLIGRESYEISAADFENLVDTQKLKELALYELILQSGINVIANALSMCEIRTFRDWKEVRGEEYYLWNYEPNKNQNAAEFMHKLVWNLVYRGECLVIETRSGELLIADNYVHERFALKPDIFRDVEVCSIDGSGQPNPYTFRESFRMQDVMFYRLNNRNACELLNQVADGYNALMQQAVEKFNRSTGEHGILTIDGNAPTFTYGMKPDGTPRTFNDVYGEMMSKQFNTYFKNTNAVLTLWKGFSYDKKSEADKKVKSDLDDVVNLTKEIYQRVATALQIPVGLLTGDVVNTENLTKNLLTFAIDPIAEMIQTENNRKRSKKKVNHGTYQMIDTSRIMHTELADIANAADKMIGAGLWSIDDARRKIGDAPLGEDWSEKHWMTKNYTEMQALGEEPDPGSEMPDTGSGDANGGRDSPAGVPERTMPGEEENNDEN